MASSNQREHLYDQIAQKDPATPSPLPINQYRRRRSPSPVESSGRSNSHRDRNDPSLPERSHRYSSDPDSSISPRSPSPETSRSFSHQKKPSPSPPLVRLPRPPIPLRPSLSSSQLPLDYPDLVRIYLPLSKGTNARYLTSYFTESLNLRIYNLALLVDYAPSYAFFDIERTTWEDGTLNRRISEVEQQGRDLFQDNQGKVWYLRPRLAVPLRVSHDDRGEWKHQSRSKERDGGKSIEMNQIVILVPVRGQGQDQGREGGIKEIVETKTEIVEEAESIAMQVKGEKETHEKGGGVEPNAVATLVLPIDVPALALVPLTDLLVKDRQSPSQSPERSLPPPPSVVPDYYNQLSTHVEDFQHPQSSYSYTSNQSAPLDFQDLRRSFPSPSRTMASDQPSFYRGLIDFNPPQPYQSRPQLAWNQPPRQQPSTQLWSNRTYETHPQNYPPPHHRDSTRYHDDGQQSRVGGWSVNGWRQVDQNELERERIEREREWEYWDAANPSYKGRSPRR
ncbi:hypothetical protein JCM5350_005204 [Sporobolomyces pararoseus]